VQPSIERGCPLHRGSSRSTTTSPIQSPRRRTWIIPASRLLRSSPTQGYRGGLEPVRCPQGSDRPSTGVRQLLPFASKILLQPEQCPDSSDQPTDVTPNRNLPKRTGGTVTNNEYRDIRRVLYRGACILDDRNSPPPPSGSPTMDERGLALKIKCKHLPAKNRGYRCSRGRQQRSWMWQEEARSWTWQEETRS